MSKRSHEQKTLAEFHRDCNVSYIDPALPRPPLRRVVQHYAASALLYGAILLFFTFNPWFSNLLHLRLFDIPALHFYYWAYGAYLVIAPVIFLLGRPRSLWVSKNLLIVGYLRRLLRWAGHGGGQGTGLDAAQPWRPTYAEKHALMFLLIKIFYGPLMFNSALQAYLPIPQIVQQLRANTTLINVLDKGYLLLFYGIFVVDSLLFMLSYHSEAGWLGNKLRFAETNPLHILVCIACYSPFNYATGALLGPSMHDPAILYRGDLYHPMTWVLRGLGAIFLLILISTTLSLFTKCSNLTNRGIVDWGAYAIVRHPGYLAKNLFWVVTIIPAFVPNMLDVRFTWTGHILHCLALVWGIVGWGALYYLRAITEERFLMRDPDYVAYCQKVKYRFIPGVY